MRVFDMHCDTIPGIYSRSLKGEKIDLRENNQHIDLMKMVKGDYLLQCFAVYLNLDYTDNPLLNAMEMIDLFYSEMEKNKDIIAPAFSVEDIEKNKAAGKMSALLTAEEGEICMGSVSVLRNMYKLGIRMMTLTWNHENSLAYPNKVVENADGSCTVEADSLHGLKEKGFEFIAEMEKLHMAIDVSHLSDAGFWDIYNNTTRPFLASHSNARTVCPHVRNLTDEMILAMSKRGCVTGINFCSEFLNGSGTGTGMQQSRNVSRVEDMVKHIKYIANLGGIDMIGLGSDFDGIGGELEIKNASYMPVLFESLKKAGFKESEVDKIFFGNALRVFKEIL